MLTLVISITNGNDNKNGKMKGKSIIPNQFNDDR